MTSTDIYTIPYTYLLTHVQTGKKYYGVRFAKGCNPSDLFITYFTSSKYVKSLIEEYGIESLLKLSVSQTGLKKPPLSINHKQKISEFQKGKPKLKIQCPHCDVIGGVNTMGRWHFDNCKLRR